MGIRTKLNPMGGTSMGSSIGKIEKVSASDNTTWVITENGDLYGCGRNDYGQQGSGDTNNVTIFTKRASGVADVQATNFTTWYLTTSGDLYGCGYNLYGQQGNGNSTNVLEFTKRASNVSKFFGGDSTTWYMNTSNELYGCGYNDYGQQGSGDTTNVKTFTKRASNVSKFSASGVTTWYSIRSGSTLYLYGCGWNNHGQQGRGDTNNVTTFAQRMYAIEDVFTCSGSTTWVFGNGSSLFGCGWNTYGQQGSGGTSDALQFFERVAAPYAKAVSCSGYTTWYINRTNELYGCGYNNYGQQGSGTSGSGTNVLTFTKRMDDILKIKCTTDSTWCVKWEGDSYCLYGCGNNSLGQQGSGTSGSGTQVTTFTKRANNLKSSDSFVCSPYTTWYIDDNKDLYGCGYNYYGQQGNGTSGSGTQVSTFTKRN